MKKILIDLLTDLNPFDEFDEETDLFEEGLLDSLTLVGMITEFEEITGVIVPEEMVTIENFTSINSIIKALRDLDLYRESK